MNKIGRMLQFIGGPLTGWALGLLLSGVFIFVFGASPEQWVVSSLDNPPEWLTSPWLKIGAILLAPVIIAFGLSFNRWSNRQRAIDDLAEEISWAITDKLLNRPINKDSPQEVVEWDSDYRDWCDRVSKKLENRAFFTRADQLHFDRLGFVQPVSLPSASNAHHNWLLGQLKLKFERLRDIINWAQQRRY